MMSRQNNEALQKIRDGLPILSPVAIRLIELVSSETTSINDLADLVAKDPSLAVRVLGLANAAFFRNAEQITTIENAVMRVGFTHLRIIALMISLKDTFPMGKVGPMDFEEFWRASLYRAIIAKGLARASGNCDPEEAFVAGLTLEIGMLIMFELFIKERMDYMPGPYPLKSLLAWEKAQFGIDHREIGEQALRCWNFPEKIIECQKTRLNENHHASLSSLGQLCETARRFSCLISEKAAGWHVMFTEMETVYGLKSQVLTPILVTAFDEVQEISESLKIDMSRERDLAQLLAKARYTLETLTETMSKWTRFVLDGQALDGPGPTPPVARYSLTEKLQLVASEIKKPLAIIREFIDNLVPTVSPGSAEWDRLQELSEEVEKVELAVLLLK